MKTDTKAKPIPAIETRYHGYRFRSRLEARWAIFLDHLQAEWSYEPEGFVFNGTAYLPDFKIHTWDCWIEIKGAPPTPEEIELCRALSKASNLRVLLTCGEPGRCKITVFEEDESIPLSRQDHAEITCPLHLPVSDDWVFGQARRCDREIWLVSESVGASFTLLGVDHDDGGRYPMTGEFAYRILAAVDAARAARFEHGESGRG